VKKKYLIVAPHYDRRSSGIKALYVLCSRLNSLGYEAYITGEKSPYPNTKRVWDLNKEELKDLQLNGVVVYPDHIVNKNPLRFTNVVRWFLGITQEAPENELVFSMSPSHNFTVQAKYNLMMLDIEPFFKFPEVENRSHKCFRVGKGSAIYRSPLTNGCTEITADFPMSREGLAYLLQSSKIFYTYDNFTLLMLEALLCGCPVVILGYPITEKKNIIGNVLNKYGTRFHEEISFDDNGIPLNYDEMKSEIPQQITLYNELMLNAHQELLKFIELTQNMPDVYVEDLGAHTPSNPHPWIAMGFWNDFFTLFSER
jgi:glycosyltransferase involved in cell wall biosynthesis